MKTYLLILATTSLLAACASPARPTPITTAPGVQIEVQPASQTHDEIISTEEIAQDNCAGTAPTAMPLTRSREVLIEARLDSALALTPSGTAQISETLRDLPIGPAIAQQHGLSYGASAKQEAKLDLSAAANSSIQHTLQQVERWETGQVSVRVSGQEVWRDGYRLRKAFELREISSKVIACTTSGSLDAIPLESPVPEATQTTATPLPTPPAPLAETPTPEASALLVETPSGTPSSADDAMGIPLETPDPNKPTAAAEPTEFAELVTAVPSNDNPDIVSAPGNTNPPNCVQANPFGLNANQLTRLQCSSDNLVRSRWVVYQRFQRGFLIIFDGPANDDFRRANQKRKFYALADDGRVWRVFYENEQVIQTTSSNPNDWYSSCAAAGRGKRPKDSGLPWRGFGRVWCDYPEIRNALGNVQLGNDEEKDTAAFQSYSEGRVFQFRGRTYAIYLDTGGRDVANLTYVPGNWEPLGAGSMAPASNTTASQVPAALVSAPAAASAASSSATALGGNRFRISSRGGWQVTGVTIAIGNNVDIRHVGGQWRISPKSPYTNHEGYASSLYNRNPMPGLRSGVLICRIGAAIIEPRNGGFRSGAAGKVACRINDDRLDDNDGNLDIEIRLS